MNALLDRRSVERSRKKTSATFVAALIIEIVSINDTFMTNLIETSNNDLNTSANTSTKDSVVFNTNTTVFEDEENENVTYNDKFENNELTTKSSVQTRAKLATFTSSSSMIRRFLYVIILKRKRENATDEEERDEHRDKIARVMMTLLTQNLKNIEIDE